MVLSDCYFVVFDVQRGRHQANPRANRPRTGQSSCCLFSHKHCFLSSLCSLTEHLIYVFWVLPMLSCCFKLFFGPQVELVRRDYVANGGWETFLAYEVRVRFVAVCCCCCVAVCWCCVLCFERFHWFVQQDPKQDILIGLLRLRKCSPDTFRFVPYSCC